MFGFGKKKQEAQAAYLGGEGTPAPSGHVGGVPNEPAPVAATPDEDDDFQFNVRQLPEGIIIKRIAHRKGKHNWKWRVGYQAANGKKLRTEYYGETLDLAIEELFRNHPEHLEAYNANATQTNQ